MKSRTPASFRVADSGVTGDNGVSYEQVRGVKCSHSNYTIEGQRYVVDGVYPTNHQEHETIELTEDINDWS